MEVLVARRLWVHWSLSLRCITSKYRVPALKIFANITLAHQRGTHKYRTKRAALLFIPQLGAG